MPDGQRTVETFTEIDLPKSVKELRDTELSPLNMLVLDGQRVINARSSVSRGIPRGERNDGFMARED
jgi:hypothetical protein